jgi:hypothetical protein
MKVTVRDIALHVLLMALTVVIIYLSMSLVEIKAAGWKSTTLVNRAEFPGLAGSHGAFRTTFELIQVDGTKRITKSRMAVFPSQEQPTECDAATGRLDHAVIDTRKMEGAYLIIVARLGTGEKSRRLNQNRLAVVEEYVLRRGTDLKLVLAESSRVKGLGRIELYVGGRLLYVMPLKKNAPGYCLEGREGY